MKQSDFENLIAANGGRDISLGILQNPAKATRKHGVHMFTEGLGRLRDAAERQTIMDLERVPEFFDLLCKAISSNDCRILDEYLTRVLAALPKQVDPSLATAFKSTYVPGAERALYSYLERCEQDYANPTKKYYGRFCSVVQSSGTGKSRTLIELRRQGAVVLYLNIRGDTESNSYPTQDEVPTRILTKQLDRSPEAYAARCIAFFTALFIALRKTLAKHSTPGLSRQEIVERWSESMCTIGSTGRASFFRRLDKHFSRTTAVIGYQPPKDPEDFISALNIADDKQTPVAPVLETRSTSNESSSDGSQAAAAMYQLLTEDKEKFSAQPANPAPASEANQNKDFKNPQLPGEVMMTRAYWELCSLDPQVILDGVRDPQVVIAFDEAHTLSQPCDKYLPSQILCRVISAFSTSRQALSIWVVFASTASKVADFSAPAHIRAFFLLRLANMKLMKIEDPSLRISQGGSLLFTPYSAFGWDQQAPRFSSIKPKDVARFENVVRFGRPLWQSLVESGLTAGKIVDTAMIKLCNRERPDTTNFDQVFALLSQRFILDICFKRYRANTLVQEGIGSHLRYCFDTSADRTWQRSGYPSEPLLSCAVTKMIYGKDKPETGQWIENLSPMLAILLNAIVDQMVEPGQKGELISRLIYLIAKDLAVREEHIGGSLDLDSELLDCRPLAVADYLAFLFGRKTITLDMTTLLDGWYINFSHWVPMSKSVEFAGSSSKQLSGMEEWLMYHWKRTSALQCCHIQPTFDKLIPMCKLRTPVLRSGGQNKHTGVVSFILISDKCKGASSVSQLDELVPEKAGLPKMSQPHVSILADLGLEPKNPKLKLRLDQGHLHIHAPGISSDIYKFLGQAPTIQQHLHAMAHFPDTLDRNISAAEKVMMGQAEFGSTMDPLHWKWDNGKLRRRERMYK
ncbi:hypothetical protein RhiJN_08283 [Ceratobasidium sp. AG-Ba]|nr:hypothetical protein RhiJN_08283 [Ceratobasidium sp. AG-Ba]QRW09070.1 hypothetical protein RhiLY_08069 [Ceratobasidium sp. AG-Ba]